MTETPSDHILFVDDDLNVLAAFQRSLRKRFTFDTAPGGRAALDMIKAAPVPYAVIVADMSMPSMNGVELLEAVRIASPDTIRIMLTGNADQATAAAAVNRGSVFRFLSKPCPPESLTAALDTALKQYELVITEKNLLNQTLNGSIQVLADIMAMLDADAFGQAQLRRSAAREVARELGIASTWEYEIAALLADIGRITLPAEVRDKLRNRQSLSEAEKQLVARIPEFSARLISSIPRMDTVAKSILYQNKNYDGSGFPLDGIAGEAIPHAARVLKAVDALVSMHRRGSTTEDTISALRAGPERYDQTVVKNLFACDRVLRAKAQKPRETGVRSLPLSELCPGQLLLSDIMTSDGRVVLAAGITLSAPQIQRVRNFASLNPVVEPISVEIPAHAL